MKGYYTWQPNLKICDATVYNTLHFRKFDRSADPYRFPQATASHL